MALGSYFGLAVKIYHTVIIDPVTNFDVVFKFNLSIRLNLVFGPNLIALKVKFDFIDVPNPSASSNIFDHVQIFLTVFNIF